MYKLRQQPNWFYWAVLFFAIALPFSEAMISVGGGLLLIAALFGTKRFNFKENLKTRWHFLLFGSIWVVYLAGLFFCRDLKWGLYDLQKNIPFLLIPLAFFLGPQLSPNRMRTALAVFVLAITASSAITLITFYSQPQTSVLHAQEYGFIHHIRFSTQLVFALAILSIELFQPKVKKPSTYRFALVLLMFYLIAFLVWHQSFTGLITFFGVAGSFAVWASLNQASPAFRRSIWAAMAVLFIVPASYLGWAVNQYYKTDIVEKDKLELFTQSGKEYKHDLSNPMIENGHFVGLYLCEEELREAWNERSALPFDSADLKGNELRHTLIRYLTSKNLRKDAAGVQQLHEVDIRNVENGISNHILAKKGLSVYPRIYVSIWEIDSYFKTGYANKRSLAQRIEYTKAAITIIRGNFWFGVGTGNWKAAYRNAYEKNQSQMDPARYGDAHNQYLNYWVKFGAIGLLFILTVIGYPFFRNRSWRNPYFLFFMIAVLIANLGDSNFETHVGSSFFAFFYCFFLGSTAKSNKERVHQTS